MHYDLMLPVRVASDASPYGIGVVLSHVLSDGSERSVAFASRTVNKAESGYSQMTRQPLKLYTW